MEVMEVLNRPVSWPWLAGAIAYCVLLLTLGRYWTKKWVKAVYMGPATIGSPSWPRRPIDNLDRYIIVLGFIISPAWSLLATVIWLTWNLLATVGWLIGLLWISTIHRWVVDYFEKLYEAANKH